VAQLTPEFPVERLCHTLDISRSAYYAYQRGQTHKPTSRQLEMQQRATALFYEHQRRYGSRRLLLDLQEEGYEVGRHQLRKLMRDNQLQAIQPRSFVPRTTDSRHAGPFSPNLLLDRPLPIRPGEVLVGDITYLPFLNGEWGYLAGWMDLFSRKISGWRVDEHMEEELVHSALLQSIGHNQLGKGSIIHSDRGGQYVGKAFRTTLRMHQFEQSMSRPDDPYDNAFMESCWSRLKAELVDQRVFRSVTDAREQLFEYIELYYNRKRRHSSLGYISPLQFEAQYYQNNPTIVS
jgi:transposase InsO family protein